jgi:starvation-inducible DNA-binding protein
MAMSGSLDESPIERRLTMTMSSVKRAEVRERRNAVMATPSDLDAQAAPEVGGAMNVVLADVFALYVKTKNFHWHMTGPHFRDYHLLLDEQADQIFAMTDPIAERVRKLGALTLKSIGQIAKTQRVLDNDADYVEPQDMLAELREDNTTLAAGMREVHELCEKHRDFATASLLEVWLDETERRAWFLFESAGRPDSGGH